MTNVTVRDVPDEVHEALFRRAGDSDRSLQSYLEAELERLASLPTPEEWVRMVEARLKESPSYLTAEQIVESIREGRDEA